MKTKILRLYEAMFLVDSALAAEDWDGVLATIKNILQRADAEIIRVRKWSERRLAYEINGKSRGTYILCYFRVDGKRIRDIERDVQLSERIMRVLILKAEGREEEDIKKETLTVPAQGIEEPEQKDAAGEGPGGDKKQELLAPMVETAPGGNSADTDKLESAEGGEQSKIDDLKSQDTEGKQRQGSPPMAE